MTYYKTKSEVREFYKSKRLEYSEDEVKKMSNSIVTLFLKKIIPPLHSTVHFFYPMKENKEVDLRVMMQERSDIIFGTSKIENMKSRSLAHFVIDNSTKFSLDKWNVPYPDTESELDIKNIDYCLVPLLASDTYGNRIGYGGGFYDKFLTQLPAKCLKIGVGFFPPDPNAWAVDDHDEKLDYLITSKHIYLF